MKKKLSLVVAGLMALTLAPVNSAFALDEDYSSVQIVEESDGTATFQAIFTVEPVDTAALKKGTIGVRLLGDDVELKDAATDLKVECTGTGQITGFAAADFEGKTQVYANFTTAPVAGDKITIKGKVKFDNAADGEYKVEYDLKDIGLIRTEKVYAKVTDKDGDFTRVTESVKKVGRGADQKLASVEVKGEVGDEITAELPSDDFEWDLDDAVKTTVTPAAAVAADGKRKVKFTMTSTKASFNPVIIVGKDSPKGEIELDITRKRGTKTDTDTVKVGEYVDHEIKLELVKSLKEELANGDTYKVDVKVKTTDKDTLPKYIDFDVDGADVNIKKAVKAGVTATGDAAGVDSAGDKKFDDNFTLDGTDSEKEVKFTLEIDPDWDANGDVVLTAKPRGYEALKLTILKVQPVAKMIVTEKEVLGGDAKVAINDIVITETKAGALKSGKMFGVTLTGLKFEDVKFDAKGSIEAEGINIKDYKLDKEDKTLYFTINGRSKKDTPAKITLKDVQVVSNRALPFGTHKLTFVALGEFNDKKIEKGTNYAYKAKEHAELFDINAVDFIKVVDKVSKVKKTTIFTLGSADYTVEGVAMKLDAPVFTQDNYTMLPVRAIADALGVEVVWNQENLTATFIDGDIVVSVTQNAKILYKNGNQYPMATKATVTADRMFIPVSSVGDAFGLTRDYDYTYNQATKQVTIYPKKEAMKAEEKVEEKKAEEVKPEEKKAEETK